MAFLTDSNRPQPLWQPPPTACLTAYGAASEVPPSGHRDGPQDAKGLVGRPWQPRYLPLLQGYSSHEGLFTGPHREYRRSIAMWCLEQVSERRVCASHIGVITLPGRAWAL